MSRTQPRRPAARAERPDAGFTLVETLTTVAMLLVLLGLSVAGWSTYTRSREADGTAKEIQAALRQAQQRAVTEGRSICVLFDETQNSWAVYRGACDSTSKTIVGGTYKAQGSADIVSPRFSSGTSTTNAGVTFLPRGTAWPGDLKVRRTDGENHKITVEGLTGRVSIK
jgi:Tfp pilus assembly protein FimT